MMSAQVPRILTKMLCQRYIYAYIYIYKLICRGSICDAHHKDTITKQSALFDNYKVHRIFIYSELLANWNKKEWLYEGQHSFRPGYSCQCQAITVCQDIADSLDEGICIDAIIIDFSKALDLVPHDRSLRKLAASGVDSRVVV